MSYDTALSLLVVLLISAVPFFILRRLRMRRRARADQPDLEAIFASHKNDSSQSFS